MSTQPNKSEYLFSSWLRQADRWIDLLSEPTQSINKLNSDKNLLKILELKSPKSVLDLGCSDGFLVDYFAKKGLHAVGVDTIEEFIEFAKTSKNGTFLHCDTTNELPNIKELHTLNFDLVVLNHGVFISDDLQSTLLFIKKLLVDDGEVIIQSIHPALLAQSENVYKDSWQACYWELAEEASMLDAPYPMYIRTFSSWHYLLNKVGLQIKDICEPVLGDAKKPDSILFICTKQRS